MHDIRGSIPLTDQTNPAKFPQYEFREYPKMMLNEHGSPHLDKAGHPVVVGSRDEEDEFRQKNPKAASTVSIAVPAAGNSEVARLEAENEKLKKLLAEKKALEAELAAPAATVAGLVADPVKPKNKGGRPKKTPAPNDLPPNLT